MIRKKLLAGLFLATFAVTAALHAQNTATLAVRAGHMFDSKTGQMLTNQVILIQGERITEAGPENRVKIPDGEKVIDLSQATVLPGLIDGHTHMYDSLSNGARATTSTEAWTISAVKEVRTDLPAGFTAARDCATHGEGYGDVDVRNAINKGLIEGPRMQVATRGIAAPAPVSSGAGG